MSALTGKTVANTRPRAQAAPLSAALVERGARPLDFPCIEIMPPLDSGPLNASLARLRRGEFSLVIFSSVNAVEAVAAGFDLRGLPARTRIAAIGAGTAAALETSIGSRVAEVPARHSAAGLLDLLVVAPGDHVFIPSSAISGEHLRVGLSARGAVVDAPVAYRTETGSGGVELAPLIAVGSLDAVAFASPSAVDGFLERLRGSNVSIDAVSRIPAGCIGPTTAARARALGFRHVHESERQTIGGLVDALETAVRIDRKGAVPCP